MMKLPFVPAKTALPPSFPKLRMNCFAPLCVKKNTETKTVAVIDNLQNYKKGHTADRDDRLCGPRFGNYENSLPVKILPWNDKYSGNRDWRAVDCTDGRSWIFSIVGVEIVCCGVADGISYYSKHTPICVAPLTHISVPCATNAWIGLILEY